MPDRGWCRLSRKASLKHRFIRFRITAFLAFRVTVNPASSGDGGSVGTKKSFTDPAAVSVPCAKTSANAPRPRRIRSLGSEETKDAPTGCHSLSICADRVLVFGSAPFGRFSWPFWPEIHVYSCVSCCGAETSFSCLAPLSGFSQSMYAKPRRYSSKSPLDRSNLANDSDLPRKRK